MYIGLAFEESTALKRQGCEISVIVFGGPRLDALRLDALRLDRVRSTDGGTLVKRKRAIDPVGGGVKVHSLQRRSTVAVSSIVLLLAGALAVAPLIPPAIPSGVDTAAFSAAAALETIERLAVEPRPIGSLGSQRARDFIVAQLRALGLEPQLQTSRSRNYYSAAGETIDIVNILARIPGTAPTKAVALMGHYDTIPATAGANDDASAVAIMLETARAVLAGTPLRNDVILLFTDGEEPAPRYGSSAFVGDHPWLNDIGLVINLETIGTGGPSFVIEMNGPESWMMSQYARAVPYQAAFSFITAVSELIGGSNTDFATLRDAGIPGFDVAYMHGNSIYHTAADAPDRVSLRSLQHQGANALALARHFGDLNLGLPHDDLKTVFFTISRYLVVQYPGTWALPIAVLTGVVLLVAMCRQRSWLRSLLSLGTTLATALIAAMAAAGIWMMLASWRSSMGIAEGYVYLALLVLLTLGIGVAISRLTRRRVGTGADAVGVVILWLALGLLTAVAVPGMSYLFTWPAWVAAVCLVFPVLESMRRWWGLIRWAVVCTTTLVMLVPAIDFFHQFAQPRSGNLDSQILAVIAIPILLAALVIELLRVFSVRSPKRSPSTPRQGL